MTLRLRSGLATTGIPLSHLHLVWPALWPLLEPAVKRSPDRPDLFARLIAREAQLWAIVEGGKPIAAVVTKVQDHEGGRRCLLWLVGGSRVREWAADFVASIEPWARAQGCVALWGCGRTGWARIAPRHGGVRIVDHEGQMAWERRIA